MYAALQALSTPTGPVSTRGPSETDPDYLRPAGTIPPRIRKIKYCFTSNPPSAGQAVSIQRAGCALKALQMEVC